MQNQLLELGYKVHRKQISLEKIKALRGEADSTASEAETACVRHIRHRSEIFRDLSTSEQLIRLIPNGLRPVRSILFDKTQNENWPVPWHQDLTISVLKKSETPGYGPWSKKDGSPHVQPPLHLLENMTTIRIHLDDTRKENGALMVIPRSHTHGKMTSSKVADFPKERATVCECGVGDILTMSPLILHSSKRSEVPRRRRVLHFEYAREEDLDETLEWLESR
ncbi:MAG: phytanoyl-CoA dioxygenase family protein [Roseibacillus sp.]